MNDIDEGRGEMLRGVEEMVRRRGQEVG